MFLSRYILAFVFAGFYLSSYATHVRAGEITYRWLYGFTFEVKLITYTTDSPSSADRCKLTIHFGDGDSAVVVRSNGPVAAAGSECPTSMTGEVVTPGVKKNIYQTIHTYATPGTYTMHMFDRNRTNGIINIPNSVNQPFYLESLLVISPSGPQNSSPILTNIPPDLAILGKCFLHSPGAYDVDGDSLSYQIVDCKGENSGVIGAPIPGFTQPNVLGGGSYFINPVNGILSWCWPNLQGEFNTAILIKEWRRSICGGNPQLVGYIIRDTQLTVVPGTDNTPVIASRADTCVTAGNLLLNTFTAADPDAGSTLQFTAEGLPFHQNPPATVNPDPPAQYVYSYFSWQTSCSSVSRLPYQVFLTSSDNILLDNKVYNIYVGGSSPSIAACTASFNTTYLVWTYSCKPTSGNQITGYNIYRKNALSSWSHNTCETGVPPYTGFSLVGTTASVNDTSFNDYTGNLINGSDCSYMVTAMYKDCSESYASAIKNTQVLIGIKEYQKNTTCKIYPNPSDNRANLDLSLDSPDYLTIKLFDMQGRLIKVVSENKLVSEQEHSIILDVNDLAPGVYVVRVNGMLSNTQTLLTKS